MKILFFNYHPVDPQLYKNAAKTLQEKGNDVLFIILEKENIVKKLANSYGFRTIIVGKIHKSLVKKIIFLPIILFKIILVVTKFKPNLIVSALSPYAGLISKMFRIKSIGITDTEVATFNNKISFPLFNSILAPDCFYGYLPENKYIPFIGYKELAYLHPNWFKPDINIRKELGINKDEKVCLMRFSALNAIHDIGYRSQIQSQLEFIKISLKELEKYCKVFISTTEKNLDKCFLRFELKIHPAKYIDLLSSCHIYIGEGTTTASEAGVLGVPWINIQKQNRGYLIDQEENYELGFRTENIDYAFSKAIEWIKDDNIKEKWRKKKEKLLMEKIDLSSFLIWFIENYPESHKIMKDDPDFQNRFK
ncbi:hypothetical protein ES705_22202 [subsurface metagenome]